MKEERLVDLINLDEDSAALLIEAGIDTPQALRGTGSIGAYMACTEHFEQRGEWETLYALEGAIRGVDWETIPDDERAQMRADAEFALGIAEL